MFLQWRWLISSLLGAFMVVGSMGLSDAAEFVCLSGDVACLISSINTANANGERNTITLEAGTYTLTTVNNNTDGPNGLPSITSILTIQGAGLDLTIVERGDETPEFRILQVEETGNMTLENLAIRNGFLPKNFNFNFRGGGIYNKGTVTLQSSAVVENEVESGLGGGIYNTGALSVLNSRIGDNHAPIGSGGGGINNLGVLTMVASLVSGNSAEGSSGGGLVNRGTATIQTSTFSGNQAEFIDHILNEGTMHLTESFVESNGLLTVLNIQTLTILNSTINGGGGEWD